LQKKVAVSLPEQVAEWVNKQAAQNFTTPTEYIRRLVIDAYVVQGGCGSEEETQRAVVYFVQANNGPIKLGMTSDLPKRLDALYSHNPHGLSVLGVIPCTTRSEALILEGDLKRQFADYRIHGEWYKPDQKLLDYVTSYTSPDELDVAPPVSSSLRSSSPPAHQRVARSGFKGVYPYGKRWTAVLSHNGSQQRLGTFDTAEAAARAYDAALVVRAGGDPTAAANFMSEPERAKAAEAAVEAPYLTKLQRGEQLSEFEWAALARANVGAASISAPSVTTPSPADAHEPLVDSTPKQLRRGAPLIQRPVAVPSEPDHED
jgi:predicted GIY-YIG superfamily endonuclease